MTITVETRCEHCAQPMSLEIDDEMNVGVAQAGTEPLVFTPDVDVFDVAALSIVDDF